MREIKFRACDIHDKYLPMYYTISFEDMMQLEIMQFTGLKDKNGVDIYEGDLVKCYCEDFVGLPYQITNKIIWGYKGGFHAEGTLCDSLQDYLQDVNGKNRSEVIGNIYQNPELIK